MKPFILTFFVILFSSFGLLAQSKASKDATSVGGMKWKQNSAKSSDTKTPTYKGVPNNQKRDSRPIRKENRK